jgi:hypothetical protein
VVRVGTSATAQPSHYHFVCVVLCVVCCVLCVMCYVGCAGVRCGVCGCVLFCVFCCVLCGVLFEPDNLC